MQSPMETKKLADVMKGKLTLSLRSAEESIVNQNIFRVLSILYITKLLWNKKNKFKRNSRTFSSKFPEK